MVHTGKHESGTYKVQVLNKHKSTWHEIEDLHITDVLSQAISISEAYLQIYELDNNNNNNNNNNNSSSSSSSSMMVD